MRAPSFSSCRLIAASLAAVAAPLAGAAMAQQPMTAEGTPCPATPAPLPNAFAAWANATALTSAADQPGLAMTKFAPGEAETLTLHPTPDVHYVVRPEKPGGTVSFGGMAALHVTTPGTYRVALGSAAWIDLLAQGKPLVSTGHGHGPDCSGIRKIVDFTLQPGDYVLQVAANGTPSVTVLVVPQG